MNTQLRLCCAVLSTLFLLGSCSGVTQKNDESAVNTNIHEVETNLSGWIQTQDSARWTLVERMAFYHINGLSIAVIHDNKIAWAKGYGWADSADQKPVNAKTLFQAASISKSLNAVGLLTLVQDKKLDLNTDINQYLTSWKFPYDSISKNKKINVANLLSHTAGLTVHGFAGYAKKDSLPTIIQVLNGEKPANSAPIRSQAVPGIQSVYSGGGITISQQILTDLTHEPYDQYMWNHVLQPMGMLNSSYTQLPSAKAQPELATGYRATGKEVEGKYHIYPEQAAAGLWTNPTDLANYIIETNLSYNGKSSKLLSQANTKLRLTPYIDTAAALGFLFPKQVAIFIFPMAARTKALEVSTTAM